MQIAQSSDLQIIKSLRCIRKTDVHETLNRSAERSTEVTYIVKNNINDMSILDLEALVTLSMHSNGILEIIKMSQKLVSEVSKQITQQSCQLSESQPSKQWLRCKTRMLFTLLGQWIEWQWLLMRVCLIKCRVWKRGRGRRGRKLNCLRNYIPENPTVNCCKDLVLPLLPMPEITFKNAKVIHVLPSLKLFRKVTFHGMHGLLWPSF